MGFFDKKEKTAGKMVDSRTGDGLGDGKIHANTDQARNTNSRAADSEKATMQANDHERDGHPKVDPAKKGPNRPGSI